MIGIILLVHFMVLTVVHVRKKVIMKKGRPQKFKETSFEQLESGVVRITIRKQYNNNAFPDDEKEGEK